MTRGLPKSASDTSRRDFVQRGAVGLVVLVGVAGCEKEPFTCTDESKLTDAEKQTRESLMYKDTAPDPSRRCSECAQWDASQPKDICGKCKVIAGPIHPDGTCNIFAKRA